MKCNITKSLWMVFLIIQSTFLYAQSNPVTGTVIDEIGEPLIGVTVIEKGTSNGTATDMDGIYTIDLQAPNAILEFSYTGYAKQEIVASKAIIDVQMEVNISSLNEITVTGIRGAQLREVQITREATTVKL